MKKFSIITEHSETPNPEWLSIEYQIVDLVAKDRDFMVLMNADNEQDYMQTCFNQATDQTEGSYCLEVRIPTDNGFKHYQAFTADAFKVIDEFSRFYKGKPIDTSWYNDITGEFNKPTIVTDSQL